MSDDYHVLALDMRGHGDSQWAPNGAYAVEDFVADLSVYAEALGKLTLAGLSLGGVVAIVFASMNPGMMERLIVVDIGPDIAAGGLDQIRQAARTRPADFAGLDEAQAWARADDPLSDEDMLRQRLELNLRETTIGRLEWKYDPGLDKLIDAGRPGDASVLWELWAGITCPTLIVRGEHSDLLAPETAQEMEARDPNATLVEIPQAGHVVIEDSPAAFRGAVRAFLGLR